MKGLLEKLGLKKFQKLGIGSAIVLIVLCELPWILALLGFTVLGSRFENLSNNLLLEILALTAVVSGLSLWVSRKFYRKTVAQQDS